MYIYVECKYDIPLNNRLLSDHEKRPDANQTFDYLTQLGIWKKQPLPTEATIFGNITDENSGFSLRINLEESREKLKRKMKSMIT